MGRSAEVIMDDMSFLVVVMREFNVSAISVCVL